MSLPPGATIGPYRIVAPLGAGGMGQVYRATDSRLKRDVALKVLPPDVAADPERLARFRREAELLAALNHPRIAQIYGVEESALVMELVEGRDLSDRIGHGPMPLAEALPIARQIAEALEAAHERQIVHRDLKPANIKVTASGLVKVLDFGLAKSVEPGAGAAGGTHASTVTLDGTRVGAVLGTAGYMSPEQARGQTADKRADVWAFGCVLYEMLAGRVAFPGSTVFEMMASVLEREPDWTALPAGTPAGLRRLLRRCLEKDPERRLRDIADARLEIDDVLGGKADPEAVPSAPRASPASAAATLALVLGAAAVAGAAVWLIRTPAPPVEIRAEISTPPSLDPSIAVSPDGSKVVFVANGASRPQLWLRALDSSSARPLPGTEGATAPFWSGDGRSIGFFAGTAVKRLDVDSGSSKTLAYGPVPLGGTWNREDVILFATNPAGPIFRIAADGGEAVAVTRVADPEQRGHAAPQFLPDGRHFLYHVSGAPETAGLYLGELGTPDGRRLFAVGAAAYAPSGHLLFVRDGHLVAQSFDYQRAELRDAPFTIADVTDGQTRLAISPSGTIAYRSGSAESAKRALVWVDRAGAVLKRVEYPDFAAIGPALSRDGQRIAVYRFVDGNMDIWSYETGRGQWNRLTVHPGDDIFPLWSPDGASIVAGSVRRTGGFVDIYRIFLTGSQKEELLFAPEQGAFPLDLSADGRHLLFGLPDKRGGGDIWGLPLDGDRKPFEIVKTEFNEGQPQFSPDGKWIAYQSDKTGRAEIYVRAFPGPDAADIRVTTDGGTQARWNPNGRELFYIAADGRLTAVPVRLPSGASTPEFDAPRALFATTVANPPTPLYRQQYMVSPDGQSFVLNAVVEGSPATPISVILNWSPRAP